jgi:phage-related protein
VRISQNKCRGILSHCICFAAASRNVGVTPNMGAGARLCAPMRTLNIGDGLGGVRSSLPGRRIARMLFFMHEGRLGVVHGFIKKSQKTPQDDIELARKRMKEMQT